MKNKAKLLDDIGHFGTSLSFFQDLLKSDIDIEDIAQFENKINYVSDRLEKRNNFNVGEAIFPFYNQAASICCFAKIKISEKDSSDSLKPINSNIKSAVGKSLNNILIDYNKDTKNLKKIKVLDWGLDNIGYEFIQIGKSEKCRTENIIGESFQFALSVAIISYLIKLPFNYSIFTGLVNQDGFINDVKYIKEKTEFVEKEFPGFTFYTPTLENFENKNIKNSLFEFIQEFLRSSEIFSSFSLNLFNFGAKRYTLEISRKPSTFCNFNIGKNILHDEVPKLFMFYEEVIDSILLDTKNGLFISGLTFSPAAPMILPLTANRIETFLALHQVSLKGYYVVAINKSNPSNYPGEFIPQPQ